MRMAGVRGPYASSGQRYVSGDLATTRSWQAHITCGNIGGGDILMVANNNNSNNNNNAAATARVHNYPALTRHPSTMDSEPTYVRGSEPTYYDARIAELAALGTQVEWFSQQSSTDYVHTPSDRPALSLRALLGLLGSVFGKFTPPHPRGGRSPSPASSLRSSASIATAASADTGGSRASSTRLASVRARVRERDVTCVVSGKYLSSECAHILANALGASGSPPNNAFLSLAHMVAGPARLQRLHHILGANLANIDTPANCLLLSPDAHAMFGLGRLALLPRLDLPVDDARRPADAALLLPIAPRQPYHHETTRAYYVQVVYPAADRLTEPIMDMRPYLRPDIRRTHISGASPAIAAGALIRLHTADPARLPLPHPLLLDLHHTLSCILAACAHDHDHLDSDDDRAGRAQPDEEEMDALAGFDDTPKSGPALPAPPVGKRRSIQALATSFWKSIKAAGGGGAAK
ncbi:hypothetical protein DFH27DRAFT_615599 [Peziza echinospora]|nr:hypothetical protein DFH27DRAFT_615599 [Peziza echinospora]